MSKASIDPHQTIRELSGKLSRAAESFVPWFLEQMPDSYFSDIDEASRLEQMGAILALRTSGQEPRLRIRSHQGRRITYVLPEDAPGALFTLMQDFGDNHIRAAKLYSSKDKQLIIDTFDIGESSPSDLEAPEVKARFQETLAAANDVRSSSRWTEASLPIISET